MGCDSCSTDSCSTGSCSPENKGLPPGMLKAYKLSTNRSDGYLVWIEVVRDGSSVSISEATRRCLEKIRAVNDKSRVWGVVFGHIELKPLYSEIYGLGVETLYEVHTKELIEYHPEAYSSALAQIIIRTEPAMVFFGHSMRSAELAGRLSGMLETGVVLGCDDVVMDGRDATLVRFNKKYKIDSFPQIATLIPECMPEADNKKGTGTVIYWQYDGSGKKDRVSED